MIRRIGLGIMALIMTAAVLMGAYLGVTRYFAEQQGKNIELVLDLNDVKKIAAYEKKPLNRILDEVKKAGVTGIGLFEETLPDAGALGELYYAKGSGILRLKAYADLARQGRIRPDRTYIYIPDQTIRKRVASQLSWALGDKALKFLSRELLEVDEAEEELRPLGLGISEVQRRYLAKKGFVVVPRVWNDPRYHLGNMENKVSGFKGDDLIIFDGEEVLGFPDALGPLAAAFKKYGLRYGYIEIVKQDGDLRLKKLLGTSAVRVHSVPKDELKKISKEEALDRFVRAARERSVRVIYLRPFLPPQIDSFPVAYNLNYLKELKAELAAAGFTLGPLTAPADLQIKGWELTLLGTGVIIGGILLLDCFVQLPIWLIAILFLAGVNGIVLAGGAGQMVPLQKALAFAAAVIFPSYAVIATLSRPLKGVALPLWDALFLVINILAETSIGIFIMVGLLADANFMGGIETFPAVKAALALPVLIVAAYFLLRTGPGGLKNKLLGYLRTQVSLAAVLGGLALLGALAVLLARSGNFVLPVPAAEKYFRDWLEMVLFVRPRTKEFLIGYPFLYIAAIYYLKRNSRWLFLLAAIGVIAPVSVFNSFSHIHTPLLISLIRTFNGLALGLLVALLVGLVLNRFIKEGA